MNIKGIRPQQGASLRLESRLAARFSSPEQPLEHSKKVKPDLQKVLPMCPGENVTYASEHSKVTEIKVNRN
jgi:hypothetical protein